MNKTIIIVIVVAIIIIILGMILYIYKKEKTANYIKVSRQDEIWRVEYYNQIVKGVKFISNLTLGQLDGLVNPDYIESNSQNLIYRGIINIAQGDEAMRQIRELMG